MVNYQLHLILFPKLQHILEYHNQLYCMPKRDLNQLYIQMEKNTQLNLTLYKMQHRKSNRDHMKTVQELANALVAKPLITHLLGTWI